MEPISLTAGAIATLAFTKFFETSVEKFTEKAIAKMDVLRKKIWDKLRGNVKAETALTAAEKGSKSDLDKVADYLKIVMNEEPEFGKEVQALAHEIRIGKIQDNSSMTQNNHDNSTGYQTKIEQGTNYLGGTHYHGKGD
jgi:acyl-coenzyme A synthetase/AMP-(fatty) acid ligase